MNSTARFIFEHWRISSDLTLIEGVITAAASTAGLTKPVTENISISTEYLIYIYIKLLKLINIYCWNSFHKVHVE